MRTLYRLAFVVVVALLFVPIRAAACGSCENPGFWNSNCSAPGCTYCEACTICCPGGTYCDLYCGGGPAFRASTELGGSLTLFEPAPAASDAQGLQALPFLASCSLSPQVVESPSGR